MAVNPLPLLVASAFKWAKENDYSFEGWTDEEIVYDMLAYYADIEDYEFEEVLKYVKIQRPKS